MIKGENKKTWGAWWGEKIRERGKKGGDANFRVGKGATRRIWEVPEAGETEKERGPSRDRIGGLENSSPPKKPERGEGLELVKEEGTGRKPAPHTMNHCPLHSKTYQGERKATSREGGERGKLWREKGQAAF